ncbi:hypothetical protein EVAR_47541_1 [Eumeta japonica]|uniref:Uncharacterized protein n=1 Tax=Eumeta variegata TaxID=151549 RepID=A0A4C1WN31_EUMVA|nr:hypothetical protein EVAR_47541_1 [Eumeta japonica]
MDPNFVRADNSNQPKIDAFTVAHFFKDNADYYAAEPKNVKQLFFDANKLATLAVSHIHYLCECKVRSRFSSIITDTAGVQFEYR